MDYENRLLPYSQDLEKGEMSSDAAEPEARQICFLERLILIIRGIAVYSIFCAVIILLGGLATTAVAKNNDPTGEHANYYEATRDDLADRSATLIMILIVLAHVSTVMLDFSGQPQVEQAPTKGS